MSRIIKFFYRIRNNNRRQKKINDNKILEIKETEEMVQNVLKKFKEDKEDELKNKMIFLLAKNLFCKRSDSIKRET